jgi:two-component system cell cycle response regulator
MEKEEVLEFVLGSNVLPTLSPVASRLISITAKDETTIGEIAELISMDMSLSVKILRVVNSAFYSFPQKVSTIHQAASLLGTNAVRSLVLSFSFLNPAQCKKGSFDYQRFWEKSLFEAVAARMMMAAVDRDAAEEAFVAGLLQELGVLILARAYPELYLRINQAVTEEGRDRRKTEIEIIGADHVWLGSEVLRSWGFPNALVEALRCHHQPGLYAGNDLGLRRLCRTVFLSGLLSEIYVAKEPDKLLADFKKQARRLLDFDDASLENLLDTVHAEVNQAASFFELELADKKSIAEVLQIANAELSVLNLSYEQMNRALVEKTVKLEMLTAELERKNRQLERLANVDGLTEAYNHRYFQNFLDQEINRSRRHGHTLSLVMADIDHFKKLNDNYGHQVGDEILRQFCEVCRGMLREYDLFARYGGEEFALVLPETAVEDAELVAEKIRSAVALHDFEHDMVSHRITASFGVAAMRPVDDSFGKSDLIGFADKALFQAKKKGRNRIMVYSGKKKLFGL